jgi:hypothetical protein
MNAEQYNAATILDFMTDSFLGLVDSAGRGTVEIVGNRNGTGDAMIEPMVA